MNYGDIVKCPYCSFGHAHLFYCCEDKECGDHNTICKNCYRFFIYGNTSKEEEPYIQTLEQAGYDFCPSDVVEVYVSFLKTSKIEEMPDKIGELK